MSKTKGGAAKSKFIDDEVVEEDDEGRICKGGNDSGAASEDDDAYESSFVDDDNDEEEEEEDDEESEEEAYRRTMRRLKVSDPEKYRQRKRLERKLRKVQELEEKIMLKLDHLDGNEDGNEDEDEYEEEEEEEDEEEEGEVRAEKEQPAAGPKSARKRKLIESDEEEEVVAEEEGEVKADVEEEPTTKKDEKAKDPPTTTTTAPPAAAKKKMKEAPIERAPGQPQKKYDPPAARKQKGLTLKGVIANKHAREPYPKKGAIARSPVSAPSSSSRAPEPSSSATSSSAATIPGPNGLFRRPMLVTRTSEVHYDEPKPTRATPDAASLSSAAASGARQSWGRVLNGADKPDQRPKKTPPPPAGGGGRAGQGNGAGASGAKTKPPVPQFQATFLDREGTLCTKDADGHVQMFSSNV